MEKITSFTIDHLRLVSGLYVSRIDQVEGHPVTTFDIRMTSPNDEPVMNTAEVHTIEHLGATFLRNHPQWKERIVYWGPMGCRTGNYLIVNGAFTSAQILPLIRETFEFIADYNGEIPGATPRDCGNYSYMDLPDARKEARRYLDEVLTCPTEANLNYPG